MSDITLFKIVQAWPVMRLLALLDHFSKESAQKGHEAAEAVLRGDLILELKVPHFNSQGFATPRAPGVTQSVPGNLAPANHPDQMRLAASKYFGMTDFLGMDFAKQLDVLTQELKDDPMVRGLLKQFNVPIVVPEKVYMPGQDVAALSPSYAYLSALRSLLEERKAPFDMQVSAMGRLTETVVHDAKRPRQGPLVTLCFPYAYTGWTLGQAYEHLQNLPPGFFLAGLPELVLMHLLHKRTFLQPFFRGFVSCSADQFSPDKLFAAFGWQDEYYKCKMVPSDAATFSPILCYIGKGVEVDKKE